MWKQLKIPDSPSFFFHPEKSAIVHELSMENISFTRLIAWNIIIVDSITSLHVTLIASDVAYNNPLPLYKMFDFAILYKQNMY